MFYCVWEVVQSVGHQTLDLPYFQRKRTQPNEINHLAMVLVLIPLGKGALFLAPLVKISVKVCTKLAFPPDTLKLKHSGVTEKHYAPWVRARREQAEADVRRAWSEDSLLETKGRGCQNW